MTRQNFIKSIGISSLLGINKLSALESWASEMKPTEKMPVLFLGHGSPMNAIEDNQFVKGFHAIAKTLTRPKAILCISAHWFTQGTKILTSEMPKTIYDFGGFPDELYQVKYSPKGDPNLAKEIGSLIKSHQPELTDDWGLDHGAWSVIKHLYPEADIPVIQMSIDYSKPASYHYELGKLLKSLRNKGILIIGSGNIIHNLSMIDWPNMNIDNHGYDWAIEVREKSNKAILDRNVEYLINYTQHGKAFANAIPTMDHYLPLIYTLALQDKNDSIELFNDKLLAGSLSMTSVKIG